VFECPVCPLPSARKAEGAPALQRSAATAQDRRPPLLAAAAPVAVLPRDLPPAQVVCAGAPWQSERQSE
jgi:hypothetical protein